MKRKTFAEQNKFKGFLGEKLRRKSVLNSELFKNKDIDYKKKVNTMLARLSKTTGT